MIKTLIKHMIFEVCIHKFFEGIEKNLMSSYKGLQFGRTYKKIVFRGKFNAHKYELICYDAYVSRDDNYLREGMDAIAFHDRGYRLSTDNANNQLKEVKYRPRNDGLNYYVYNNDIDTASLVALKDFCYCV